MKTYNPGSRADLSPADSRDLDLRNTDELYRALIDQAPDAIFVSDRKFRFIEVNPRGCEMSGYSREEVLRKSIFDLMVPEEVVANPLKLDELQRGKTVVAERRLKRKDRTIISVEVTSKLLSDGRLQAIVRDIGLRQQAEATRRHTEERFRALIEHSDDAIALFSADGAVLYASPSTTRVLGYQPDDLLQRNMLEFIRTDWQEKVLETLAEVLRRPGVGIPTQAYIRNKEGEYRFLEGTFTNLLDEPSVGAIVNNYRDVTERKRTEEARGELSRLLDESLNEIYVFDAQTLCFIQVNQGARHNLGYTPDELRTLTPLDLKPEFDAQKFEELLRPLRAGEKSKIVLVTKHRRRDESLYDVEVHLQMAKFEGRSVFVAIILDITERMQAEAELMASTEQLRALSARLLAAREEEGTRIAREIHDELGGVLTGLKWDLEDCDRVLSGSANGEPVDLIRKKIPVMTGLLDNTIDTVRRISSELRPGVLDDLGLIAAIKWQAQQFQQRTGIECRCEASLETIDLNRDQATAIFRVFQEVLTNVIRHAQATRVELKTFEADGEFVLEVKDNGRGISESERQNMRSLGLLGMHERVQLIGGTIEIGGAKGKGTRVVVRVPLG